MVNKRVAIFDADMIIFDVLGVSATKYEGNVEYFSNTENTKSEGLVIDIVNTYDKVSYQQIREEIFQDCGVFNNERVNYFFRNVDYRTVPTMKSFDNLMKDVGETEISLYLQNIDKLYICSKVMPDALNTCTKTIAINTHIERLREKYPNIKEYIIHYTYEYGVKVDVVKEDELLVLFVDDNYKEYTDKFLNHYHCKFGIPTDVIYIDKVLDVLEKLNLKFLPMRLVKY